MSRLKHETRKEALRIGSDDHALWVRLVREPETLTLATVACREEAWRALAWAQDHLSLEPIPVPVPVEQSEEARTLVVALRVLAAPPPSVSLHERLERARAWSQRLRYPLLDALYGSIAAEAGQVRLALAAFEGTKNAGPAFPEVPVAAGRALMLCAGNDPRLLHKAEWYLVHAEHLILNGDDAGCDVDEEGEEEEVGVAELDEASQRRLADIWSLMAKLYARLGDLRKAEMYRTRAGGCLDALAEDEADEGEGRGEEEWAADPSLKAADRKLLRGFFESPQFRGLSPAVQRQGRAAVPFFVLLGRQYLGVGPTRLDRYSLEEILVSLMPERMVAPVGMMELVPPSIIAWIHFLGKSGHLRDAGRLGALVQGMGADYMAGCRNPERWSMAKTVAMKMLESGVNLEDQSEVDHWLSTRFSRLVAV